MVIRVNFCKFTNETRNAIEDASAYSGQTYLCAVNGPAAGGGYELALACEHLILIDDGSSTVSLPEIPLLAVLPGTGGLTRLVDKRHVRRDHADVFCTTEEGVRGQRALQWRLVDELVAPSKFDVGVQQRAQALAADSDRPQSANIPSLAWLPLERQFDADTMNYRYCRAEIEPVTQSVTIVISGPRQTPPADIDTMLAQVNGFWPLLLARELDDLLLHLRFNHDQLGTWVFKSVGDVEQVAAYDQWLFEHRDHWLVREVILFWKRLLKRLEVSARSAIALIEPGSCFVGTLLEIALSADRSYMLNGQFEGDERAPAVVQLTPMNFGPAPMINGLTRLQARFLDVPEQVKSLRSLLGQALPAEIAEAQRLVTFIPDDIDWEDEIRIALEERASFSPDALSGMEANLRFGGPETLESKIFGRLSAWQNWIFQRPNAVGERGALSRYGTGKRSEFETQRI